MRVDQVLPSLASRDAIGTHTMNLQRALRATGLESDIYYGACTPDMAEAGRPVSAMGRARRDRFFLYQASIGSPVFDVLEARDEVKLANYHNITPPQLLDAWEPEVAYETSLGRAQLERLAPHCRLAIAVSRFNEQELRDLGFASTAVVPLLVDVAPGATSHDGATTERLAAAKASGGGDLLYVGKISPHKAPHDLVKMLALYRRLYDPAARLHLVGSPLGEHYAPALRAFVEELGLDKAVEITGSVPPTALESYWQGADVYVSASDHEGFCAPLIEAMAHGVPVVAFGAAAVPETVEGAGIILDTKEPLRFAAAVARVATDGALRARLQDAGRRRAAAFSVERSAARYVELVRAATGG